MLACLLPIFFWKFGMARLFFILYFLLIVFTYFDGMCVNSKFHFLPTIRTLLSFSLATLVFCKYRFAYFTINKYLFLFYCYLIIIGIIYVSDFFEFGISGFLFYKQNFLLIMYGYIIFHYERATSHSIDSLLRAIVYLASSWCVLNNLFFFIPLDIWDFERWIGRIAMGYPTVDVVLLNFALFIVLNYNLSLSKIRKSLCICLITLAVIEQFSGTGTLLLLLNYISYFIHLINNGVELRRLLIKFLIFLFPIVFFVISGLDYFKQSNPLLYEAAETVILDKYYVLTNQDDKVTLNTMEMRADQENDYSHYADDDLKSLFGIGFGRCDYVHDKSIYSSKYVMIESQYGINTLTIGLLGQVLFILSMIIVPIINSMKKKDRYGYILVVPFVFFSLSCFTTTTMNSFPIQVMFSLYLWGNVIPKHKKCSLYNIKRYESRN